MYIKEIEMINKSSLLHKTHEAYLIMINKGIIQLSELISNFKENMMIKMVIIMIMIKIKMKKKINNNKIQGDNINQEIVIKNNRNNKKVKMKKVKAKDR